MEARTCDSIPFPYCPLTEPHALQSSILSDGYRSLAEGEDVEYEVGADQNGRPRAVNVSGPNGQPPKVTNINIRQQAVRGLQTSMFMSCTTQCSVAYAQQRLPIHLPLTMADSSTLVEYMH